MTRYSLLSLARNALTGHRRWAPAWRDAAPKPAYDVVIVGGGGHGLATAHYLASRYGVTNVAVLEKGWIGGGNTARNTTIVRSNYLLDDSAFLYEHSLKLWEGLTAELDFNVMFSQRGVVSLAHSAHELTALRQRDRVMRLNGIDSEMLDRAALRRLAPALDLSPTARFPVVGASIQRRGGIARHDAVAWGFARAADRRGVDIVQNCAVTGLRIENGRVTGVETTRGLIRAGKVGIAVAGHSGVLAAMAGLRLPIRSYTLQAFVSEPLKPVLDTVIVSNQVSCYVSQSDKGELVFGAARDNYSSYSQRGSLPILEDCVANLLQLFPAFSRVGVLRGWGGTVDVSPDLSPIIGPLPVEGLFINCGWGTGGFKATPGSGDVFAATIARGAPHPLAAPFGLDRFATGRLIDEAAAAGVSH
ncbi:sarcosine oxidase subunit beta (plasmid) [Azospirillum sp. TSH58]|uniref:sarcosine oxidase subunit beta family protein n=1 Tax=Azospirillum sp. TSH58 TaxID=664962 RepID=UPI000D6026D8|nr:sarcosine oxidase subunit beta family protein [Azospirillum sp. TSH58]AWJ87832.1 sarcosine oxidase subunit beta [Azospirillum sp. TSH58]PWC80516.1 sarcosine oxidase subunit beta [Azospirillum sp. TSH58]